MKRYALAFCAFLLMISITGCSSSTKANPWGFLQSPSSAQTPRLAPSSTLTPVPTASTQVPQSVQNTTLTLTFAFGQKTGVYSGQLLNGVPDGSGKFTTTNDNGTEWTYEGTFKSGHFQGQGTTTWSDNWSEKGTYVNDYLTTGESFYKGLRVYSGSYASDEYNGQGTTYDETGHVVYEGEFKNGYLNETEEHRVSTLR